MNPYLNYELGGGSQYLKSHITALLRSGRDDRRATLDDVLISFERLRLGVFEDLCEAASRIKSISDLGDDHAFWLFNSADSRTVPSIKSKAQYFESTSEHESIDPEQERKATGFDRKAVDDSIVNLPESLDSTLLDKKDKKLIGSKSETKSSIEKVFQIELGLHFLTLKHYVYFEQNNMRVLGISPQLMKMKKKTKVPIPRGAINTSDINTSVNTYASCQYEKLGSFATDESKSLAECWMMETGKINLFPTPSASPRMSTNPRNIKKADNDRKGVEANVFKMMKLDERLTIVVKLLLLV